MRFFNYKLWSLLLIVAGVFVTSCDNEEVVVPVEELKTVADYDHSVVTDWNKLFLEIERYAAGYRPGPAPRALAYIGLASYEATVPGMVNHQSVASRYAGLTLPQIDPTLEYHWPTVVNAVRATLMRRFFPTAAVELYEKIGALENANNTKYQAEATAEVIARSKARGEAVANAVWEWSKTDQVGHDAYLDPFKGYNWQDNFKKAGDWKATTPGPGKAMFPFWGRARTFAISEADKLCPPPLAYGENSSSALYAQAVEVYANTVNASYENVWIAEYWSDDLLNLTFSPPSRWIAIAIQVYDSEDADLETALLSDAKIGLALNDAGVACWHSKYYYNVERPQTYINRLIDKNWKPILYNPLTKEEGITPSFPAYPSGHATFGAAAAEALTDVFGIDHAMADRCHENRTEFEGKPRSFGSFYEMAEESAWSRVPLGVHYRMDAEQGVNLGYRCGRRVNALPWDK